MDLNLAVIMGRLAAKPEVKTFEAGARVVRLLVTTRIEEPKRRVDVIPITVWENPVETSNIDIDDIATFERGDRVWVAGSVQRRFWTDDNSRRSRIEVVAVHVQRKPDEVARVLTEMAETAP